MNKSGKGHIFFILLIPVFIIAALIVVDTIIGMTENKKYRHDTEEIIKEVYNDKKIPYNKYYDEIKKRYERKGYKTERLVVEANDYRIYVENEHVYFGLFTSLSKRGEEVEFTFFNIEYLTFRLKKNSKLFLKVEAKKAYDSEELEFVYSK